MLGLFSFSGRTTRLGYLGVGFVQIGLMIAIVVGAVGMSMGAGKGAGSGIVGVVVLVIAGVVAFSWIGLAATARRLRDMGWPVIYGYVGLIFINFVGRLVTAPLMGGVGLGMLKGDAPAQVAGHAMAPSIALFVVMLSSSLGSLCLMLWPSAKTAHLDDIEDIFGGENLPEPAYAPDPIASYRAEPRQAVFRPAPVTDPSAPRAQFGLRKSF